MKDTYPVGQAPWETGGNTTQSSQPRNSYPVGQAPWETSQQNTTPSKPTFGQDESKDWNQTTQDRQDFQSGKVGLPESFLRVGGDVSRLGFLNPVKHLVTNPIASGYNKLANMSPEISPGKHILPTEESAGQAAQGLGIPQAIQSVQDKYPRATRNIGSAVDVGSTVAGITGLVSGVQALRTPQETLEQALIRGGAATNDTASGLAETLSQHGITSLSPDKIKVAANILENAASGTTDPSVLQNILDASKAVDQMSGIPAPVVNPGLLSKLAGVGGKLYRGAKEAATVGGIGYGGYRALGGQPLFGSF